MNLRWRTYDQLASPSGLRGGLAALLVRSRILAIRSLPVTRPASRLIIPLLLLATAGCGLLESENEVTVDGTFEGTTEIRGDQWRVRLALSEAESHEITGSGTLARVDNQQAIALAVDGVHQHPDLTLSLVNSSFYDKEFTGTVAEDGAQITGTIRDPDNTYQIELTER